MHSTKKFLFSMVALLALAACETAPTDGGLTGSSGNGGYESGSNYGGVSGMSELAPGVNDRVFFGYDSSAIDSMSQDTLSRQAAWLQQNPGITITVEGHCDERGTREYNIALGERRAYAAKKYLISQGVSPNRVSTISYGKERPAVAGSNADSWAQNRRAVTVVAN